MKAFVLWLLSTSPVILAVLFSRKTDPEAPLAPQLVAPISESFTLGEMFVYASAFLAPVIFIAFEVIQRILKNEIEGTIRSLRKNLRGIGGVILVSLLVFAITLGIFVNYKSDNNAFQQTVLFRVMSGRSYLLYIISLLLWYTAMLWDAIPSIELEDRNREQAQSLATALKSRTKRSVAPRE